MSRPTGHSGRCEPDDEPDPTTPAPAGALPAEETAAGSAPPVHGVQPLARTHQP
jgi:hypothetical protein